MTGTDVSGKVETLVLDLDLEGHVQFQQAEHGAGYVWLKGSRSQAAKA